ncbi:MAG: DUF5596 domain-containing protein [Clostridia bacterium]|nr:DUF5596 domain-containing protein [Clostridia bacterium]
MRAYICDFLEQFNYPQEARECLLSTYDQIMENGETRAMWEGFLAAYEADYLCDLRAVIAGADRVAGLIGINEFTVDLLIFICLSKHLKALYVARGIPMAYYEKSMADLRYKLDECQLVYGVVGSFVADWFRGFFHLTRFGIGRLQFEIIPFNSNYEKNGIALTPTSKVLNVHIPRSGEPLTEEACLASYLAAKEFFKDEIGMDPCPFVCHSWLLDPQFDSFMPRHTNTYRFYKSFDIYEWEIKKDRRDLWRLFDTMEQNPDRLPADSSMRRAFIEHLKRGGRLGAGRGILFV